ncbi:MAG: hypothetical protein HUJ73_01060, partial [Eubacterium sp.]|nr:hypothetical protein [Eubacterium sp.]
MIKKLRQKFILLATVTMLILTFSLVGIMNLINYSSVISEAESVVDVVSQPNAPFFENEMQPGPSQKPINDFIPRGMSPEVPYESRFFTAMISRDGTIETDVSRITSVGNSDAAEYIRQALEKNTDEGFIDDFLFVKTSDDLVTRITFLDCGRRLNT